MYTWAYVGANYWLKHCCRCCHWQQRWPNHWLGLLSSTSLWPSHCKVFPWKNFTKCGKFWSSVPSTACRCSHALYYYPRISSVISGWGYTVTVVWTLWDSVPSEALAAVLMLKARHMTLMYISKQKPISEGCIFGASFWCSATSIFPTK